MPVRFQREKIDEWLKDAYQILYNHLREASDVEGDIVDIDFDSYTNLEHTGALHIVTGRNEKDELVAYWIGLIIPHSHNKKHLSSFDDNFWVRPDYRGITVYRLYKFLEEYYESLGVKRSYHIVKPDRHSLGGILEKLGYAKLEETLLKVR